MLGGAAGPGVFGASAGLGASLGGLSTAASILSGGATVASVLMANQAGQQQAAALNMQASDAEMSARLEQVQGLQRRNSIKAALVDAIGERDVAAAASGVDLSFGTPAIARDQAQIEGSRALTVDQNTESFNRSRLFERAANYRTMAKQASAGGLGKAATLALEGGAKLARRG
ncbi:MULTISPECIES: hypothetical protein [Rhodopseudomonas]|uniref:hypothetical protein n=1 Tax=Rhodopseudomonas TaxID=1073 RepID=UPI00128D1361|nr:MULTISPECIES: hypothetical protein [Rhodopseudomonas]MDF3809260.1 hypothetical protein [Rhodopseudomonas sp. BAL398]WOK19055.1 hypothetical protein RBJ75_05925 [Rhodopseudomonas sp. BAL398]